MSSDADFELEVSKLGETKPVHTNVCPHTSARDSTCGSWRRPEEWVFFLSWASFLSIQVRDVRRLS